MQIAENAALNQKVDDNLLLAIAVNGLRSEIRYSRTHPNKMYLIHRINLKQALPKKNTQYIVSCRAIIKIYDD